MSGQNMRQWRTSPERIKMFLLLCMLLLSSIKHSYTHTTTTTTTTCSSSSSSPTRSVFYHQGREHTVRLLTSSAVESRYSNNRIILDFIHPVSHQQWLNFGPIFQSFVLTFFTKMVQFQPHFSNKDSFLYATIQLQCNSWDIFPKCLAKV